MQISIKLERNTAKNVPKSKEDFESSASIILLDMSVTHFKI